MAGRGAQEGAEMSSSCLASWGPTQSFANKIQGAVRSSVVAGNPEVFKKQQQCRTAHLQGATLIDPQCSLICLQGPAPFASSQGNTQPGGGPRGLCWADAYF